MSNVDKVASWADPYPEEEVRRFLQEMVARVTQNLLRLEHGLHEQLKPPDRYLRKGDKPRWSGIPGEPYAVLYDTSNIGSSPRTERMCRDGVTLGLWTVHSRAQPHKKIGVTGLGNSLLRLDPATFPDLVELLMPKEGEWDQVGCWLDQPTWRTIPRHSGGDAYRQAAWVWRHRGELEFLRVGGKGEHDLVWRKRGSFDPDLAFGLSVMGRVYREMHAVHELHAEFGIDRELMRQEGCDETSGEKLHKNLLSRRRDLLNAIEYFKKARDVYRKHQAAGGHLGIVTTVGKNMRALLSDRAPLLATLANDRGYRGDKEDVLAGLAKDWLAGELQTFETDTTTTYKEVDNG